MSDQGGRFNSPSQTGGYGPGVGQQSFGQYGGTAAGYPQYTQQQIPTYEAGQQQPSQNINDYLPKYSDFPLQQQQMVPSQPQYYQQPINNLQQQQQPYQSQQGYFQQQQPLTTSVQFAPPATSQAPIPSNPLLIPPSPLPPYANPVKAEYFQKQFNNYDLEYDESMKSLQNKIALICMSYYKGLYPEYFADKNPKELSDFIESEEKSLRLFLSISAAVVISLDFISMRRPVLFLTKRTYTPSLLRTVAIVFGITGTCMVIRSLIYAPRVKNAVGKYDFGENAFFRQFYDLHVKRKKK